MIDIELIEILQEYRNGNKDVINKLCTYKTNKNSIGDYQNTELRINYFGLENNVYCWYEHYTSQYKYSKDEICPKFHEQIYNGDIEDMKQDLMLVLLNIFDDKSFQPSESSEIFSELKYRMMKLLGASIETSALAKSEIAIDENYEEYSLLECVADDDYTDIEEHYVYIGVIAEIVDILQNYDVKSLLKKDAYVQRNVIDIIYKYYDYHYNKQTDEMELPSQNEMIQHYKADFGTEIYQSQYSRALSDIFKAICNCTISLKGVDITREHFIDKETNIYDIQKLQLC